MSSEDIEKNGSLPVEEKQTVYTSTDGAPVYEDLQEGHVSEFVETQELRLV